MRESGASVVGKQVLGPERNDSDATITGFVLQQHLPSLLIFLSYKIPSMRFAALGLIGTLLRQGKLILSFLFYFAFNLHSCLYHIAILKTHDKLYKHKKKTFLILLYFDLPQTRVGPIRKRCCSVINEREWCKCCRKTSSRSGEK